MSTDNPIHSSTLIDEDRAGTQSPQQGDEISSDEMHELEEMFDRDYYLENNADIREAGINPFDHFIKFGWREHRDPSGSFSIPEYLRHHTDIVGLDLNPVLHFIRNGKLGFSDQNVASGVEPEVRAVLEPHFDPQFYLTHSPELSTGDIDLLDHYIKQGWRELRDPSPHFSVSYYLGRYPDIRSAGIEPFCHYLQHGAKEGRVALPYRRRLQLPDYLPLVSVIVPNFNHARFLGDRLSSIRDQTYSNIQVILLDDASGDNSREILSSWSKKFPGAKCLFNDSNSGGVFFQWERGINAAEGELIWICESDDFCDKRFLEFLVPMFADRSINIGFGRIQFTDEDGLVREGLDAYREAAEQGIWDAEAIRPAHEWFYGPFGISNLIANVGGCVFRRQVISNRIWSRLRQFKICGDWYLYSQLCNGGRIAYQPKSIAYFRQHGLNTSVSGFLGDTYYREHEMVAVAIRESWGSSDAASLKLFGNAVAQFRHFRPNAPLSHLLELCSADKIMRQGRSVPHVLIAFLGFHLGGGEIFPIFLANELVSRGLRVSILALDTNNENSRVQRMLDQRVSIYDAQLVEEIGITNFVQSAGIDLIHSHNAAIEFFFFGEGREAPQVPYAVTLHGSYEVTPMGDAMLMRVLRAVKRWIYLTPKNLLHLRSLPIASSAILRLPNGMPADQRNPPFDRHTFGINSQDVVAVVASRAIQEKGWRVAAEAIRRINSRMQDFKYHLILCGEGPEEEYIRMHYADDECIHVVGFQDCINGVYRLADLVLLPSRFPGESFPLTLIQAMQEGRPIIASNIGEIKNMVLHGDDLDARDAGIVIPISQDDDVFTASLEKALEYMLDKTVRDDFGRESKVHGGKYSMTFVGDAYVRMYSEIMGGPLNSNMLTFMSQFSPTSEEVK